MKKFSCRLVAVRLVIATGGIVFTVFFNGPVQAQNSLPYDTTYTFEHYKVKRAFYEALPDSKNEIVFLGNSITEHGNWAELFKDKNVINRGIGGDVCFGVLDRLGEVLASSPKTIFLMIGINDIGRNVPVDTIAGKVRKIIKKIKTNSPHTRVYLQSVLPINEAIFKWEYMKGKSGGIVLLNRLLRSVAEEERVRFIDLYTRFADQAGNLKPALTADGIHLSSGGYLLWRDVFREEGIRF